VSPAPTERPSAAATVALVREPDSTANQIADALLELREARSRLRRADSLLAALLVEPERHPPQNAQEPANTPAGRLPRHAQIQDDTDADVSRTAS
jgi:hypothetical protein